MLYGKDFVYPHSNAFEDVLRKEISKLLKVNEILFDFTKSSKKRSYYVTLLNTETHRWITFRISDHKPKGNGNSLQSFYYNSFHSVEEMIEMIQEYLEETAWEYFSYNHFFILKAMNDIPKRKGHISTRIPKGDVKHYIHKMKFQYEIYNGSILIEIKNVEDKTNNILRALYIQNVITSDLYKTTRRSRVYIPLRGKKLLDHFHALYYDQYEDDFSNEVYEDFKLPEEKEQLVEQNDEILLNMEGIKAFNNYYVYGLINNDNKALIHIGYHLGNLTKQDLETLSVMQDYKHNESMLTDITRISPVVFMTDVKEYEAQLIVKSMINQYMIFNPAHFGDVVSFNHMYNYASNHQIPHPSISSKIYGDQKMIAQHTQTKYIDIERLRQSRILIVKLSLDTIENNVSSMKTYASSSNIIKKFIVGDLQLSEEIAKKIQYIIGIHPHDGRVIAVFKVKDDKKRYTKFKNETGRYKYTFNFYAYTMKISSINNITLVKTTNTVLTNYTFVDKEGKMKKSKRRTVFVE